MSYSLHRLSIDEKRIFDHTATLFSNIIKFHIKQFLFGHVNATKGNVELHRHYGIFTVIWNFNILSIFTPSLIHLRTVKNYLNLGHGASGSRNLSEQSIQIFSRQ